MPNWETARLGPHDQLERPHPGRWSCPGILFTLLGALPVHRAWVTGDKREHHLLDRPRNMPTRTGLGVDGDHVLPAAAGRRRQRHHRDPLRPVDQRDHLVVPGRALRRCRRSPTSSPSGSAWACSAATATSSCTAARPASSGGCRPGSSSRSTRRSRTRSAHTILQAGLTRPEPLALPATVDDNGVPAPGRTQGRPAGQAVRAGSTRERPDPVRRGAARRGAPRPGAAGGPAAPAGRLQRRRTRRAVSRALSQVGYPRGHHRPLRPSRTTGHWGVPVPRTRVVSPWAQRASPLTQVDQGTFQSV